MPSEYKRKWAREKAENDIKWENELLFIEFFKKPLCMACRNIFQITRLNRSYKTYQIEIKGKVKQVPGSKLQKKMWSRKTERD